MKSLPIIVRRRRTDQVYVAALPTCPVGPSQHVVYSITHGVGPGVLQSVDLRSFETQSIKPTNSERIAVTELVQFAHHVARSAGLLEDEVRPYFISRDRPSLAEYRIQISKCQTKPRKFLRAG